MDANALKSFFPQPQGSAIARAFQCIEIAEQELERVGLGKDRTVNLLAFMPGEPFRTMDLWVYRAHARELAERIRDGLDCRVGTDAEAMLCFLATSLKAPLEADYMRAYAVVFERSRRRAEQPVPEWLGKGNQDRAFEAWAGRLEEILGEVRGKLKSPTRMGRKEAS